MPSALRPRAVWKARTAAAQPLPKMPSKPWGIVPQAVEGTLDNPGQVAPGALADVDAGRLGLGAERAVHLQPCIKLAVELSLERPDSPGLGLGPP